MNPRVQRRLDELRVYGAVYGRSSTEGSREARYADRSARLRAKGRWLPMGTVKEDTDPLNPMQVILMWSASVDYRGRRIR
jgi:hypothetical protein